MIFIILAVLEDNTLIYIFDIYFYSHKTFPIQICTSPDERGRIPARRHRRRFDVDDGILRLKDICYIVSKNLDLIVLQTRSAVQSSF